MFFASGLHLFFRCLQPDGAQVTTQRRVLFAVPLLCHCKSQMSAPRQVQMDSIQETKVVVHSACCCCYDGCVPELNNIGCAAQEKGGKEWISEVRAGKNLQNSRITKTDESVNVSFSPQVLLSSCSLVPYCYIAFSKAEQISRFVATAFLCCAH